MHILLPIPFFSFSLGRPFSSFPTPPPLSPSLGLPCSLSRGLLDSTFLESVMGEGIVSDGTIAQDQAQSQGIWRVREGITGALSKSGAVYKCDRLHPSGGALGCPRLPLIATDCH